MINNLFKLETHDTFIRIKECLQVLFEPDEMVEKEISEVNIKEITEQIKYE